MQMDVFFIFAAVAFFIWSIRSIFFFVNEWQRILSNGIFKRASLSYIISFFLSPLSLITWLGVVFSVYVSVSDFPLEYDQYFIIGLLLIKAVIAFREISKGKLRLPQFNPQIVIIICLSLLLTALAFAFPLSERYLWLLILDRLLFVFVCIPIFLVLFPGEILDDLQVRKSVHEIKKFKKLKPVLILGSDAKETAYFIDQLLRKDKDIVIVSDPFLRMSTIGRAIINDVNDKTEYIFIVYSNSSPALLQSILRQFTFYSIVLTGEKSKRDQIRISEILSPYLTHSLRLVMSSSYSQDKEKFKKKKKYIFTYDTKNLNSPVDLSLLSVQ